MSGKDQHPIVVPSGFHSLPSTPLPPPPSYESELAHTGGLRDYLHILLKRKWWAISAFLSVFLLAVLYIIFATPIFRSSALLQITQDNPGVHGTAEEKLSLFSSGDLLEKFQMTQHKILQSWSLGQRVIQALNLKDHPEFKAIRENSPDLPQAEIEDIMVKMLLGGLEITPVRNSYLVEVGCQSPDKGLAQKIANAVADEFVYLSIDRRNESFALVRKWLDKQLQDMADKVHEAQKRLYKFGQKADIYTMEEKENVVVQKFIDLSSLLTKAQAEKMSKEAQYQQIKDKGPNAPLIVNHPLVAQLRQNVVAQQAKVSALRKVYRGDHPDLQAEQANLAELQTRLQSEIQRLQESVKADYEAAKRTEKLLSDSFSGQKDQMAKLQDNLTDFQILKRDAQTNEQLYQALLSRVKEANIASTMVPSNVAVIDSARLPSKPFKPNKRRILILAGFLGLTLGIGLALLVENLDDSIKSVSDLERACRLPSLGILPLMDGTDSSRSLSHQKKRGELGLWRYLPWIKRKGPHAAEAEDMDLCVYKSPHSIVSEAINQIFSSIMLSASGRPPHVIMVTSPNPSEGKSMLVSNLGQSFALHNHRVVIIDCDLRKPRLNKTFQVALEPGLTNYLSGNATLEEIIHPTFIPNLKIIPAGTRPPNPTILLNSEMFKELLEQLRRQFQRLIIDTPPVLQFADARFISALVDGVLLVTKYQSTHKSASHLAHQLLSQAPILGAVLNSVDIHGQTYGGYYYYDYYKYYSKY